LNLYLTKVGEALKPTRDFLNWTQAGLAKQTGLSRATIVNMESEPWRMTRTSALAIFSVVLAEINRRNRLLEEALQQNEVVWLDLLKEIGLTNPKSWSKIIGSTELISTGLIPLLGGIGLVSTGTSQTELTPAEQRKLSNAAIETLHELTARLCQILELDELSLDCFISKLDETSELDE